LEHRYYGQSLVTPTFSTTNLKYLSSRQALADAARFIRMKRGDFPNAKWVVWGCSYSGSLSAWFRAHYPDLVVGSIAPSGPVFAKNNFTEYYEHFGKVASPACVQRVKGAVRAISSLLDSKKGLQMLSQTFNTCVPLTSNQHDIYYFLYSLTGVVGSADQFQNPPQWPLNATCNALTAGTSDQDTMNAWANLVQQQNPGVCNEFREQQGFLIPMQQVSNVNRLWVWQQCTEFGWRSTTYPGTSIFWDNLTLPRRLEWCAQIYGIANMRPNIDQTNIFYGGYNLNATKVLFTNGVIDPWSTISIREPNGFGVEAITYFAGHCAPMTAATNQDPITLTRARKTIDLFVSTYLSS